MRHNYRSFDPFTPPWVMQRDGNLQLHPTQRSDLLPVLVHSDQLIQDGSLVKLWWQGNWFVTRPAPPGYLG